jgi:ATP-dependent DNA helicase RecQ
LVFEVRDIWPLTLRELGGLSPRHPLVALMQDQVEALAARGLGDRVALVNAQQDRSANAESLRRAAAGELRLLYVAPERFAASMIAGMFR